MSNDKRTNNTFDLRHSCYEEPGYFTTRGDNITFTRYW